VNPSTIGLSPKLYPAILALIVGVILLALGERETGLAVIGTALASLGLGYVAPPGLIVTAADGYLDTDAGPDPVEPEPDTPKRPRRSTKRRA
jgi:hypothetical protein